MCFSSVSEGHPVNRSALCLVLESEAILLSVSHRLFPCRSVLRSCFVSLLLHLWAFSFCRWNILEYLGKSEILECFQLCFQPASESEYSTVQQELLALSHRRKDCNTWVQRSAHQTQQLLALPDPSNPSPSFEKCLRTQKPT